MQTETVEDAQVVENSGRKNVKIRNNSPSLGRIYRQRSVVFWNSDRDGTYVKPKN